MSTSTDELTWSAADPEDEPATHGQPDQPDDEQGDGADAPDDRPASVGEVQRIRARAREAESERDTLRSRVERLQISAVETIAARHLADPRDLLLIGGITMAELVGEDGEVDGEAVAAACTKLVETRGERFARRRTVTGSPDGGARGAAVGRAPATLAGALASAWRQERSR